MIRPLPDTNIVRGIFHGDFSKEEIAKFEEIVRSPGFECVAAQEVVFELVAPLKDQPTDPVVLDRAHGNFGILHRLCGTRLTPMRPNRARTLFGAAPLEERWEPIFKELIESVASPEILTDAELLGDVQRAAQTIFGAVVGFNQQKTGDMFSTLGGQGRGGAGARPHEARRRLRRAQEPCPRTAAEACPRRCAGDPRL
jgi:hypothetical protein